MRGEDDLHQIGFVRVEALEPARTLFERSDGRDQRLDLDFSAADEVNGLRVFA